MPQTKLRVCAVSYLNTVPLVWGMLHGSQRGMFDLISRIPSQCADMVAAGEADIGILPAFELLRQDVDIIPGLGIASRGPVRSILLVSKRPLPEIGVLAADASSRTSVALARVVLARRYGVTPQIVPHPPDIQAMLEFADAALLIGDSALRIDPAASPWPVWDLGAEWQSLTGLPMVFAVWAGRRGCVDDVVARAFRESYAYGAAHIEEIVRAESAARGFPPALVHHYLTANIVHALGEPEYAGMRLFLDYAQPAAGVTG